MMFKPEYNNIIIITSIIGFIILIISALFIWGYYTVSAPNPYIADQDSKNRIDTINHVFSSYLGNSWPITLFIICIFFVIIIGLLIVISNKDIQLNISESQSSIITKVFIAFVVIFSLSMLGLAINAYRKAKLEQDGGNIPNYQPATKSNKQFMLILGIILLLIVLGITIFFIIRRFRTQKK